MNTSLQCTCTPPNVITTYDYCSSSCYECEKIVNYSTYSQCTKITGTCYCQYRDVLINGQCEDQCGSNFATILNNVTWEQTCFCNTSEYVLSADGSQCLSARPACEALGSSRQCAPMTTCYCLNKTNWNGSCVDECRVNFEAVMNSS